MNIMIVSGKLYNTLVVLVNGCFHCFQILSYLGGGGGFRSSTNPGTTSKSARCIQAFFFVTMVSVMCAVFTSIRQGIKKKKNHMSITP